MSCHGCDREHLLYYNSLIIANTRKIRIKSDVNNDLPKIMVNVLHTMPSLTTVTVTNDVLSIMQDYWMNQKEEK